MALQMKATTSPTLTSGAFTMQFGQFAKVKNAEVMFDDPLAASTAFAATVALSGNTATITIKKQNLGSPGGWANAVTSDLSGKVVRVIADGE